ncbi:MAG TPA: acetate uptake transporter [Methanoregula sp.]|nr:acetate uptake transporter [Methanoregula sp.]
MELTESPFLKNEVRLSDSTANPGALGLLAFGMTTLVLNMHNAGLFAMGSVVFAMGIFYGGIAQVIAGIMEWKKNNIFGMTAFISYGFFWLSLVAIMIMPAIGWTSPVSKASLVGFFVVWLLFSVVMYVITRKLSKALQVVFGLLVILFVLLIAGNVLESEFIIYVAGGEGIICGLTAMYAGLGQVANEVYKENVVKLE